MCSINRVTVRSRWRWECTELGDQLYTRTLHTLGMRAWRGLWRILLSICVSHSHAYGAYTCPRCNCLARVALSNVRKISISSSMVIAALTCGRVIPGRRMRGANDNLNFQRGQNCGINVLRFFLFFFLFTRIEKDRYIWKFLKKEGTFNWNNSLLCYFC